MHVTRFLRATGVVVVAGTLYGTSAQAQSSTIVGTVYSAESKQAVADVVVTATSPDLQGAKTVVTDAAGHYRLPQLPSGTYTLRFESEGFRAYARSDIQLKLHRTIRVNVELLPSSFTEELTITGAPPTVDVGTAAQGLNVDQEFIRRIAVNRPGGRGGASRSFESLAELAPGAQEDSYGVSLNGATSPENGYLVDGISTNDPAFGLNASPLSVEFVQDVSVITGGYMPEFGRSTGGVITAVTRSGSNEFRGSVFFNAAPGFAEGRRRLAIDQGSVITGNNALKAIGDFGATLGGPLLKDKLWFFAGVAPSFSRYTHTRAINAFVAERNPDGSVARDALTGQIVMAQDADGNPVTQRVPGSERDYFVDQRSLQYMGKLTYLVNEDHNVALSVVGTPSTLGGRGRLGVGPLGANDTSLPEAQLYAPESIGTAQTTAQSTAVAMKYAGALMDKKFLIDANLGWFHQVARTLPVDGSLLGSQENLAGQPRVTWVQPRSLTFFEPVPEAATYCGQTPEEQAALCPVNVYETGGPGYLSDATLQRYQLNAKATYLLNALGQHLLKAGVDVEHLVFNQTKGFSGGVQYGETDLSSYEYGGRTLFNPANRGDVQLPVWGFIDQRRFGYQTGPDQAFTQLTQQALTQGTTFGGFLQDSWALTNRVTVNAGVRYDTQVLRGGDGTLALILGNQLSPRVGVIVDPLANGRTKLYANFARYYQSVPLNLVDRAFPGERYFTSRYYGFQTARDLGEDLGPGCDPRTPEGEQVCGNYRVRLAEDRRNPNRMYVGGKVERQPVDPDITPQSSDEYVLGGEYEVLANTRLGLSYTHRELNTVIEDMSRDDGYTYFLGNPGRGFAGDFPEAVRRYDAVNLYVSRTFSDGWLGLASYTWSYLRGNFAGLFRPENGQLSPNLTSEFDLRSLLDNREGPLPFDRTHQLKLFGAKEFRMGNAWAASVGASYRGASGTPINYLGSHPLYGFDETFILPRGAGGYTPWVHNVDSNLRMDYRVSKDNVLSLTVDIFNIFNLQTATAVDQRYTTSAVLPVKDGTVADLPTADSEGNVRMNTAEGGKLSYSEVNRNFGQPLAFQPPRSVRVGLRYSF